MTRKDTIALVFVFNISVNKHFVSMSFNRFVGENIVSPVLGYNMIHIPADDQIEVQKGDVIAIAWDTGVIYHNKITPCLVSSYWKYISPKPATVVNSPYSFKTRAECRKYALQGTIENTFGM